MLKRFLSVLLAATLLFSIAAIAHAEDAEPETAPHILYFDTTSTGWEDFSYIAFHIWAIDDPDFVPFDWGGKKQRGKAGEDGVWSYDLDTAGLSLKDECQYAVIFYDNIGRQTYNLLFDFTCFGDTAYADTSNMLENPEDSNKSTLPAYWTNQDPTVNGPELKITSIGNVVGECMPRNNTTIGMLANFISNTMENTKIFTGSDDQQIIDNIGEKLGMTKEYVLMAIEASGEETTWDPDNSPLPNEEKDDDDDQPLLRADYDGDGEITVMDATRAQRILAELDERPSNEILTEIDADGDGELTIMDATKIQRVIAGLDSWDDEIIVPDEPTSPVEEPTESVDEPTEVVISPTDEYELPFVSA